MDNVTMWWKETEMRMEMEMGGSVLGEEARGGDIQLLFPAQGGTWVAYCTWCDVGLIRGGTCIVQGFYTGTRAMTCLPPTPSNPPRCDSIFRKFWEVFLGVLSQMDL